MQIEELRPNLARWTGLHPEWGPTDADWEQEVACVLYESDAVALIDPLVPPEDSERFLRWLDSRVARARKGVVVVLAAPWHARSCTAIVDRYRATLWAHPAGASRVGREVTAPVLPQGVETFEIPPADEGQVAILLPEHGALVTAEILTGTEYGLVVRPSPRLEEPEHLRTCLELLGELPTEIVLPAHGAPVLADGRAAIAAAIAGYAPSAA